ncbi:branched-chain amino acid ABC transporter permease [Pelagibacteraceae bacterium]|nr:branched-chain amino acid ABC transporter permease [Pelagibacteraceae bacterium]
MQLIQLIIDGVASGCIYGLVALGFVLIYKATETINFAQGDILMLGAFVAFSLIGVLGMDYIMGFALTVVIIAVFGFFLDSVVVRQIIGQPPFATVMLTIGIGFILRGFASIYWGTDIFSFSTPFSGKITEFNGLIISYVNLSIIIGTVILVSVLYLFFTFSRIGVAMRASSENQLAAYYMGIPVKFIFSLIWSISAATAAIAGVLLAPITLVDTSISLIGLKAFAAAVLGGFGSIPGAIVGGIIIGIVEQLCGTYENYLFEGVREISAYLVLILTLIIYPRGLFSDKAEVKKV